MKCPKCKNTNSDSIKYKGFRSDGNRVYFCSMCYTTFEIKSEDVVDNISKTIDQHEIYTMKLHSTVSVSKYLDVLRVPGGWIYHWKIPFGHNNPQVFVPFNNEFMEEVNDSNMQ